tara:strand:+ start:797 stop:967 length:171 start_codon:yes stop_codon:yes gene_type:complete
VVVDIIGNHVTGIDGLPDGSEVGNVDGPLEGNIVRVVVEIVGNKFSVGETDGRNDG